MTTATMPKAKKLGSDAKVKFRQNNRTSKWDDLMKQVMELEDGESLELPVPGGRKPELFRNTISNAVYNHVRKPELFPDYRFPVKLSADLKHVYIVCEADDGTGEDEKPKRAAKPRKRKKD